MNEVVSSWWMDVGNRSFFLPLFCMRVLYCCYYYCFCWLPSLQSNFSTTCSTVVYTTQSPLFAWIQPKTNTLPLIRVCVCVFVYICEYVCLNKIKDFFLIFFFSALSCSARIPAAFLVENWRSGNPPRSTTTSYFHTFKLLFNSDQQITSPEVKS